MRKQKKIQFLMTAEQWLGVVLLTLLVVGVLIVVKRYSPNQDATASLVNDSTKLQFIVHQEKKDSARKDEWQKKIVRDTIDIRMQDFDPNTVDSCTLVLLGLKPWQARAFVNYRSKGAVFRKAEDIKRLNFVNDSIYKALAPYIYIAREEKESPVTDSLQRQRDSIPKWLSENKDTVLNLRTADTTELKMIRGISSYRAKQIVLYRERLGGFVRVEQVMEARGMEGLVADSILRWFTLDSIQIDPLYVNVQTAQRLSRHPYLRFEQAKAIYELRRKKITLKSVNDLEESACIDAKTLEKIAPYLNFDKK